MSQLELTCARCRRRLEERLDGTLGERERSELDAHLAGCAECRAHAEGLTTLVSALGEFPELELPDADLEAVWRRTVDSPPRHRARRWPLVLSAAAAVLVAGLFALERHDTAGEPTPAELAQAKADLELVAQLTQHALRVTQRGAVDAVLHQAVNPVLQQVPLFRRN